MQITRRLIVETACEDAGMRAAVRIRDHAPMPVAMPDRVLDSPHLDGALQRLSGSPLVSSRATSAKPRRYRHSDG